MLKKKWNKIYNLLHNSYETKLEQDIETSPVN